MSKGFIYLFAAIIVILISNTVFAQAIVNGGFEAGDLSGWNQYPNGGSITVETSWNSYAPVEGGYFALIDPQAQAGNNAPAYLIQYFSMDAGDTIEGYAAFYTNDYSPHYDYGIVSLNRNNSFYADLWRRSIPNDGSMVKTSWEFWSFTATEAGNYRIDACSSNADNDTAHCYMLIDGVRFTESNPVPEPATMLLFGPSLLGLVGLKRKKSKLAHS